MCTSRILYHGLWRYSAVIVPKSLTPQHGAMGTGAPEVGACSVLGCAHWFYTRRFLSGRYNWGVPVDAQ